MHQREKKFNAMKMPSKKEPKQNISAEDETQQYHGDSPSNKKVQIVQHGHPNKKGGVQHVQPEADENIEFQENTNRQTLAVEILRAGYIQSFIDFYLITNKSVDQHDGNIKTSNFNELESEDKLLDLKRDLTNAEQHCSHHFPDKQPSIEGYYKLAEKFFEEFEDYDTASYFYKRCIHIAKNADEKQLECKGKLGLGKCFDRLDKTTDAIEILEKNLKDADQNVLSNIVTAISIELIRIYNKVALSYERGDAEDKEKSLYYYEKCLEVAKKADREEEEGNINHKIGLLYFKEGKYPKSIEYQKKYLEINQPNSSEDARQKQMEAHAALAKCYIKMNQAAQSTGEGQTYNEDAQYHLEKYNEHAEKLHMNNAQSDAALHLATLYHQKGNITKSLDYYKQHFDGARTEKTDKKDRKLVDKARVTFGIAKANAGIDKFIEIVKDSDKNLKALIEWKAKKEK